MKKIVDIDSDIKEVFHHDAHDGKSYLSYRQDVDSYLKAAHRARSERGEHTRYKSEVFNKKASIPLTVAQKWCKDKGIEYSRLLSDDSVMRSFLNDPDNKSFLLIPGKV